MIMKNIVVRSLVTAILLVVSGLSVSAQVKQFSNDISEFNALEVEGEFEISLVGGNSYNVLFTVDEDLMDYVICSVNNKTLTISIDEKKIPKEIKSRYKGRNAITATYKATITAPAHPQLIYMNDKSILYDNMATPQTLEIKLVATDKSIVKSFEVTAPSVTIIADKRASINSTIGGDYLALDLSGNSNSTVNAVNVRELNIKTDNSASVVANGDFDIVKLVSKLSSKAILNGTAVKSVYDCGGSSNINASNLNVESADVVMSNISKLHINVSSSLNLNSLSGGSALTYSGSPVVEIGSIVKSSVNRSK